MCSGYKWLCVSILPRGMGWPLARKKYGEMFKPGVKFWWLFGWFICFKALFENLTKNQTGLEGCTIVQQYFLHVFSIFRDVPINENTWVTTPLASEPRPDLAPGRPRPHRTIRLLRRFWGSRKFTITSCFCSLFLNVCLYVFWFSEHWSRQKVDKCL